MPAKRDKSSELESLLRRLAIVAGVVGTMLVVAGISLAARPHGSFQAREGGVDLVTFFLLVFSLPGALLLLSAPPVWRGQRWGCWLAQLTGGFLFTVFTVQAYRTAKFADWRANRSTTLWLMLAVTMAVLVVYLIRGGWAVIELNRRRR